MRWDALAGVKLNREQMEQRRFQAAEDLLAGMQKAKIARKYGVSPTTVGRWNEILRNQGIEGLQMRKATGQPHHLTEGQRSRLVEILVLGAGAYGWDTDIWTGKRATEVIEKEFGVTYHFKHLPRLLRKLGFRPIKPKHRAMEKDEDIKEEWLRTTWAQEKKT